MRNVTYKLFELNNWGNLFYLNGCFEDLPIYTEFVTCTYGSENKDSFLCVVVSEYKHGYKFELPFAFIQKIGVISY